MQQSPEQVRAQGAVAELLAHHGEGDAQAARLPLRLVEEQHPASAPRQLVQQSQRTRQTVRLAEQRHQLPLGLGVVQHGTTTDRKSVV